MTIKGVLNNLIPVDFVKTDLRKTRESHDREPQQGQGEEGRAPERHDFTEEELKQVIQQLKEIPGVKANNLQFRVVRADDGRPTVFVEDPMGKVIRRIPDTELWAILKNGQKSGRGQLLNKAL